MLQDAGSEAMVMDTGLEMPVRADPARIDWRIRLRTAASL